MLWWVPDFKPVKQCTRFICSKRVIERAGDMSIEIVAYENHLLRFDKVSFPELWGTECASSVPFPVNRWIPPNPSTISKLAAKIWEDPRD